MKIKKLLFLFIGAGLISVSCQKEDIENVSDTEVAQDQKTLKITDEVRNKVKELNFNADDIEVGEMQLPDGSTKQAYVVEGDIFLDAKQLENMKSANVTTKQYRSYNLVYAPKTINVLGFTGTGFGQNLTAKQQEALRLAIANYNSLDLSLSFTLSFGANTADADIVVFQNPNGQAGGVAGFPSNGNPYGFVQLYSGLENYSLGVNQHVVTHEIGHTLGLRHTDWFTRQSCGRPTFGELANPSGAVHIPGTPRAYDPNSIMLACFSSQEDGEFGENDIVALNYLY